MKDLVRTHELTKVYGSGEFAAMALRGIDLGVEGCEFMAVIGPSGSGKTTLLNIIGALDTPSSGQLELMGQDVVALGKKERAHLRLHQLGFVFQAYNLVPVLTALENVEFVLELQGKQNGRRERAREVLDQLGLSELADRRPNQLSGGQQQRVAVARAIASKPKLVLADEPTANLDGENAEQLLDMMHRLNTEDGITFIFSTHDPRVISHARRTVRLEDGRVVADEIKG